MGNLRQIGFGVDLSFLILIMAAMEILNVSVEGISVEEDLALTAQEKLALDKFKGLMKPKLSQDYMKHDIYLIRWLRARNFNVERAEEMLLENLRWRKQHNMDTISSEDWTDLSEDYPYHSGGRDKQDRFIGTINMGAWNIRRVILSGRSARFNRYMSKMLEEATQMVIQDQRQGLNVTQWKVMLNMEGFNLIQQGCPICLPIYTTFTSNYEEHYPGYADAVILVNTPPAFQVVMDLIRPILAPQTRNALKIFGVNKQEWNSYLDKSVGREERRPEFGGTKID